MRSTAEDIIRDTPQLPPPPQVMTDLLVLFARPEVDARRIADAIAGDVVLSLRTLKVANSPFYGLSKRITSVHEAIAILGFRSVRLLVLAVGAVGLMQLPPGLRTSLGELLRHSTRCAMLARLLAERTGHSPEEAFTAGLLHDVGKMVLVQATPRAGIDASTPHRWVEHSDLPAEREAFGTDHAELGMVLLERWQFPDALCESTGKHHEAPDTLSPLSALVALADGLAHTDLERADPFPPERLAPWIARAMGASPLPDAAELAAAIDEADALARVLEPDA
ncbi:HDOD domain-containing protein [Denitromonas iodatirespirans]|uniref:HDOD domain-containing protein n=1 Tax=Denitromonas iodatirespirans TaxID=2795389 RepID=A0A944D6T2_DENI1|nr:HDOD domain-containing protein [Denitromonas iodatirespirans]MBT0960890.1 HDOD domain-containing protein [Denitromonas iodatirespirans]